MDEKQVLCAEIVGQIRAGSISTVMFQMMKLPSIDHPLTSAGSTALAVACSVGDKKLVNALLMKKKADPSIADANGQTCVAKACMEGHLEIVRRLYRDSRVDLRLPDKFGLAPLHHAIAGGHFDVAQYLLDASVNPNTPTGQDQQHSDAKEATQETPLHVAARRLSIPETLLFHQNRYDAFKLLMSYRADPCQADRAGDSMLHVVARQGDWVGLWVCLANMDDIQGALDLENAAGVTIIDEADSSSSMLASLALRFARFLPQTSRQWLLTCIFNESINILKSS